MATAIEFEHVGKQYRLGLVSTRTLSHDLNRWWQMAILKKEDPYLKIGETNDRAKAGNSEYVWALRDIDFKVEQGDVVGIIGKNGAGKSTLLKLLSKVTGPTVGTIRAQGRIGALLEVGTGFHPEMTGRENIFMNGAIMGMSKQEISSKLDEIIDFSGCERYIDTPVKRYSSGMTVRLGFAVAAHLDPEILVVDEVLAVGDAEFQKKAIGKMQDVSRGEGRTVLFVSHNMASIRQLCNHTILLDNGKIERIGETNDIVDFYLQYQQTNANKDHKGNGLVRVTDIKSNAKKVELGQDLELFLEARINGDIDTLSVAFDIKNENSKQVAHVCVEDGGIKLKRIDKGNICRIQCIIRGINLAPGSYYLNVWAGSAYECYDWIEGAISFYVSQNGSFIARKTQYGLQNGAVVLSSSWSEIESS